MLLLLNNDPSIFPQRVFDQISADIGPNRNVQQVHRYMSSVRYMKRLTECEFAFVKSHVGATNMKVMRRALFAACRTKHTIADLEDIFRIYSNKTNKEMSKEEYDEYLLYRIRLLQKF